MALKKAEQYFKAKEIIDTCFIGSGIIPVADFKDAGESAQIILKQNPIAYGSKVYHLFVENNKFHIVVSYVGQEADERLFVMNTRIKPESFQKVFQNNFKILDESLEEYFRYEYKESIEFAMYMDLIVAKHLIVAKQQSDCEKGTRDDEKFVYSVQPWHEDMEVVNKLSQRIKEKVETEKTTYIDSVCKKIGEMLCRNPKLIAKLRQNDMNQNCDSLAKYIADDLNILLNLNEPLPIPTYVYSDAMQRWERESTLTSFYMSEKQEEYSKKMMKFGEFRPGSSQSQKAEMEVSVILPINSKSTL